MDVFMACEEPQMSTLFRLCLAISERCVAQDHTNRTAEGVPALLSRLILPSLHGHRGPRPALLRGGGRHRALSIQRRCEKPWRAGRGA